MIRKRNEKLDLHKLLLVAFFALLAVLTVVCEAVYKSGSVGFSSPPQRAFVIAKIIFFTLIFLALFKLMAFGTTLYDNSQKTTWLTWQKKDWIRCTAILFLIYLVYLIIFYPGLCNYDTTN